MGFYRQEYWSGLPFPPRDVSKPGMEPMTPVTLLMYGIIIFRGIKISIEVNDRFLKFLCLGLSISLFVQVFINTGVVVGL